MAEEKQGEGVPDGTIDDVLNWVGDDSERAQQALDEEQGKDSPRTTLIDKLEKQASGDDQSAVENVEGGDSVDTDDQKQPEDGPEGYDAELDDPDDDTTGHEDDSDAKGEEGTK